MVKKETLRAYLTLAKPGILKMVLVTTFLGFYLAQGSLISNLDQLFFALLGTALTCGGSGVLNHYLERDIDCKMTRTANRPIPMGVVAPNDALAFGIILVLLGTFVLAYQVNLITGFLALLTAFLYVLVYTPLKRVTWWNTFIGAIPGALPPVGGWTAVTGEIELGAVVLFLILFIWQHPHFYAIAWMYRDDYAKGGLKMLPVLDPDGSRTCKQIMIYSLILIPVSLLPKLIGMSGWLYFWGALGLGLFMLYFGTLVVKHRDFRSARNLMRASIVYLPLVLVLICIDSIIFLS
jgi:protoheme IX farnesyltransferase